MLALAGLPGTSGFMGKLFLIEATVDGDYTWLGVAIVIGTMVSLAYYLRVIAAVWMWPEPSAAPPATQAGAMPAIAGGSPEADAVPQGREPLRADRRLGPDLRRGHDRLRRRPLAADRLGLARGQLAGDDDLAAVIFGAGTRRRDTTSGPRSSTPCRT